jgi:hypothetical protein
MDDATGPQQFTDAEVQDAMDTLEHLAAPSAEAEAFRASRATVLGPRGLLNRVYEFFVTRLPANPRHLLEDILDRVLQLGFDDDDVPTFEADGRTYRGDEAIEVSWHRRMRIVHILEMVLYVNGILEYDGSMSKGGADTADRWMQIVGCCTHIHRLAVPLSALRVYQHRHLLTMASNGGKNPTFDLVRLEAVEPKSMNRFQRLIIKMLRDARSSMGGLRKYDGRLFRAKRVPRRERVRNEDGTLRCAHEGCPGEAGHESAVGKRADHVFRPVLRTVPDGRMYSTHAFVPIDQNDDFEGLSKYRSATIGHFVQHCTDRQTHHASWLDMTASQQNLKHVTEYLHTCIDEELPSLSDGRDRFLFAFMNGTYHLDRDEFCPYWCSGSPDDPEACDPCQWGTGECLAAKLAASPAAANKYFNQWLDMAHINECVRGAPDTTRQCARRYQYNKYVYNRVCRRCGEPDNRHKKFRCRHTDSDEAAVFVPQCAACGTLGQEAHVGSRRSRPEPPCSCWAPYRMDDVAWTHIPTPYLDDILRFQRLTYDEEARTRDTEQEEHIIAWVYALLGRLRYPNDHERDRWQVALMITGTAATGKTTIGDFTQAQFNSEDVAIMQARSERDFGTSALLVRDNGRYRFRPFVLAPEMSSDERGMDQTMWQSMITGGSEDEDRPGEKVTVAIKNETAKIVQPQCQVLMMGNEKINFKDPHGQFSRRVVEMQFLQPIPADRKDGLLKDRLLNEMPEFIVKSNRAYRYKYEALGGKEGNVWGLCPYGDRAPNLPKYFHDIKTQLQQEANVMTRFLNDNGSLLVFDESYYIPERIFVQLWNEWKQQMGVRARWEAKTYEFAFRARGIRRVAEERPWEPGTDVAVHDTYLVGVSVADDKEIAQSSRNMGWFPRPSVTPAAAAAAAATAHTGTDTTEAVDRNRWSAVVHDTAEATQSPIDDINWQELFRVHQERLGATGHMSKRIVTLFYGMFARSKRRESIDCAERLFRDFEEFERWRDSPEGRALLEGGGGGGGGSKRRRGDDSADNVE